MRAPLSSTSSDPTLSTGVVAMSSLAHDAGRRVKFLAAAVLGGAALTLGSPALGAAAVSTAGEGGQADCSLVASPSGSDTSPGTLARPLHSVQALANALKPGQVGCLRGGTYGGGISVEHGGTADAPLVIEGYAGERAEVTGRVYVKQGSDYVAINGLVLNGNHQASATALPSPTVNADHVTFEYDDVTNEHTTICFDLGNAQWGTAADTVIAHDTIHDCGKLPATNYDHGIYVAEASGTQIIDNVIMHNADRGIQLYPDSTAARIEGNVIAENGENIIFSGDGGVASSDNVVEHNLIVNATTRHDVESWYPEGNPAGSGNVVRHNCVSSRGIATEAGGFTAESNVTAAGGEVRVSGAGVPQPVAGSACAAELPAVTATVGSEGTVSGGGPTPAGKEENTTESAPEVPSGTKEAGESSGGAGSEGSTTSGSEGVSGPGTGVSGGITTEGNTIGEPGGQGTEANSGPGSSPTRGRHAGRHRRHSVTARSSVLHARAHARSRRHHARAGRRRRGSRHEHRYGHASMRRDASQGQRHKALAVFHHERRARS